MADVKDLRAAYDLLQLCQKNPRIKEKTIRSKVSPYSSYSATKGFLKRIRKEEILFGPKLWINSGFVVDLVKKSRKSSLELFEKYQQEPQVTYVMGLMGTFSLLAFKRGASILKYAICTIPSYPGRKSITEIELTEKGPIERDEYPRGWDELDWKVFNSMRDPTRSFGKVGGELGVSWTTAQAHYKKILKDCKIWVTFFPEGYSSYQQAILTFETDYEENLKKELEKIDRTSFLYKYNNTNILFLLYHDYRDLRKFELLKKEKKIRNLTFSTPIAWKDQF
ncbi:MAG: hypothetical protein HXS46_15950 [Theionarchaea archaeon]|nr:hypothetical protein [Theionarchaea archaeon]